MPERKILIEQYLGLEWVELITLDGYGPDITEVTRNISAIHRNGSAFTGGNDDVNIVANVNSGPVRLTDLLKGE